MFVYQRVYSAMRLSDSHGYPVPWRGVFRRQEQDWLPSEVVTLEVSGWGA